LKLIDKVQQEVNVPSGLAKRELGEASRGGSAITVRMTR